MQWLWWDLVQRIEQLGVDHIIYTSLTESVEDRATIGWTVSYICSIAMRHSMHRVLVFGEYGGSYWMSLGKTYLTYSSSIIISMITNYYFTAVLGMSHSTAAIVTLLWTGIYNFFLLKACWNSGKNKKVTSPKTEDGDADDKV